MGIDKILQYNLYNKICIIKPYDRIPIIETPH